MHRPNAPISLADLSAAGVKLRPYEAVTIVRELLRLVARGDVAGVPSAHVIRLSSAGVVSVEGPVAAGGRPVVRAAQLLESLLPGTEDGNQFRVPGGLKLIVARALGTLDLPPFGSLESFAEALARFADPEPSAAIANLVASRTESDDVAEPGSVVVTSSAAAAQVQPFVSARTQDIRGHLSREPLTVSDIRRARRATGLPLSSISARSHIPVGMLRQLEWGYFRNWPTGQYGRTQLIRYARAAGLDEDLVVSTLLPQLEQAERTDLVAVPPAAPPAPVSVPAKAPAAVAVLDGEYVDAADTIAVRPPSYRPDSRFLTGSAAEPIPSGGRWRAAALAALAIPALLVIGLLPAWWNVSQTGATPDAQPTVASRQAATETPAATAPAPSANSPVPVAPAGTTAVRTAQPVAADTVAADTVADEPDYVPAAHRAAFSPALAAIGTAMFYAPGESEGSTPEATDSTTLRVTKIVDDPANNLHVRPSPDGRRIAFDSDRDGVRGVYVANEDGSQVRRVSAAGFAALPSWSPDSKSLVFVRAREDSPEVWNLWTVSLESGELKQLTAHTTGQSWGGSWFPDGRRIAYAQESAIVIHDLQNGSDRQFRSPRRTYQVRNPVVSPDGRRVAFVVERDGVWLLEMSNGSMRRVLEDPTVEECTWSPDGRRLAYFSRRSGGWGVWVMAPRAVEAGATR